MSTLLYLQKQEPAGQPAQPFRLHDYKPDDGGGRLHGPSTLAKLQLVTLEVQGPDTAGEFVPVSFDEQKGGMSIERFLANTKASPLPVTGQASAGPVPLIINFPAELLPQGLQLQSGHYVQPLLPSPAVLHGPSSPAVSTGDGEDAMSFASSSTDIRRAAIAHARLGWRLSEEWHFASSEALAQVPILDERVPWTEVEPDSINKGAAKELLSKALRLSELGERLAWVEIERKIVVRFETVHQRKRTKVSGKSDFALVQVGLATKMKQQPRSLLHEVYLLLETKPTKDLEAGADSPRGSGALECMAVNWHLLEESKKPAPLPCGVPVLMTDVNTECYGYVMKEPRHVCEIWFPEREHGFSYFADLLKTRILPPSTLRPPSQPLAGGGGGSGDGGGGGDDRSFTQHEEGQGMAHPQSAAQGTTQAPLAGEGVSQEHSGGGEHNDQEHQEPQAASHGAGASNDDDEYDLAAEELVRPMWATAMSDAPLHDGEVYIETWDHALLRAFCGEEEAHKHAHQQYRRVPAALAGYYAGMQG